jgi:AcrR family transcriptional regulator
MARLKSKKSTRSKGKGQNVRSEPSSSIHLSPRKHPRQERAKETVAVILEAAAEVFAERGYAGATTNKIAHRAGVSIGSLYQYYPNKDAILTGLRERHLADVEVAVERSMMELADVKVPIDRALDSLLRGLIDLHEMNPKLTRALSEDIFPPHLIDGANNKKEDELYARETEKILRRRPDVRPGNYAVMAHVLVQTIQVLTRWFVHEAPSTLEKDAFIDEALCLVAGYVQRG